MIKINLATRKQSGVMSETRLGSLNLGGLSKVNIDNFKDLPIKKLAVPLITGLLASYAVDFLKETEIKKQDDIIAKLNADGSVLQDEIGKLKSYEPIKKVVDEDEVTIKTKLDTIRKLIADRNFHVKVLLSISSTIPKNVWLSDLEVNTTEIGLRGSSLDFNQISDFMKSLTENAYFTDVVLKNSQTAKDETGLDIASFDLMAKRR
jgi:Tfp pilus assembly protein PilN